MVTHTFAQIVNVTLKTTNGRRVTVPADQINWSASESECGKCGSHGEIELTATIATNREPKGTGYFATPGIAGRSKVHATKDGKPACGTQVRGEYQWTNGAAECKRCRAIMAADAGSDLEFITAKAKDW